MEYRFVHHFASINLNLTFELILDSRFTCDDSSIRMIAIQLLKLQMFRYGLNSTKKKETKYAKKSFHLPNSFLYELSLRKEAIPEEGEGEGPVARLSIARHCT